jgi:ADP-dependent phosphofructokinase/glucokinase
MRTTPVPVERYLDVLAGHPMFVAYNANVDAMVTVDETVERVLEPPKGRASPPLDSPGDLSSGIWEAMVTGEGNEMRITDEFGEWLAEHLDPEECRLGGQAGIFADVLSVLGADPVLYTYLFSSTQRSMLTDPSSVRFPVVEDGHLTYRPASDVTNADRTKTNWIFEFADGREFHGTRAVTDSRFIAAARPEEFDLEVGHLDEHAAEVGADVECALLSGFHSLKEEYADGTTFADHIDSGASFLRRLRSNGDVTVQVEYAVTHIDPLREAIHEEILPHADALGIDTRELDMLASDLGVEVDDETDDITGVHEQARAVRELLDLPCLKLHATDYFLAVTGDYLDPETVRAGFEFASVVAATRAARDGLRSPEDLETGTDVPLSVAGKEAVVDLAADLDEPISGPALATDDVVIYPNRVVEDPENTVGLGDTVSAASFALETGLTARQSSASR